MDSQSYSEFAVYGISRPNSRKDSYIKQSALGKFLFSWMNGYIQELSQQNIEQKDILDIHPHESTESLYSQFEQLLGSTPHSKISSGYIVKLIVRLFFWDWFFLFIARLIYMGLQLANPLVVNLIVQLFEGPQFNTAQFTYTTLIFFLWLVFLYIAISIGQFLEYVLKAKIQVTFIGKIFHSLYSTPLPHPSIGELTNYIQIDSKQVSQLASSLIGLTIIPLQIIGAIYVYFSLVNYAAFLGILGVSINFFVSLVYGRLYADYQKSIMKSRDQRIKGVEEMLAGIRTIKQNMYENVFESKIEQKREAEMEDIKKQFQVNYFMSFIIALIPVGVQFATFSLFDMFSIGAVLIIQQSYYQLSSAVATFPANLSNLLLALTSVDRLNKFIFYSVTSDLEAQPSICSESKRALQIIDGCFQWKPRCYQIVSHTELPRQAKKVADYQEHQDEPQSAFALEGINIDIYRGQIVLILGANASGKSSLINAILGELQSANSQSKVLVNGSVSVAAQEPWVLQATIKNNIILDQPMNVDRFVQALEMAQLCYDLSTMPAGHNTEVGERGQTLSGGQRRRVHLARALYLDKDIYILDNPLTALDHTTGVKIAKGIKSNLQGKTVIIASNTAEYWEFADLVICLAAGRIQFQGTMPEFQRSNFAERYTEINSAFDDLEINVRMEESLESMSPENLYDKFDKPEVKLIGNEERASGKVEIQVFKQIYNLYGRHSTFVKASLLSFITMLIGLFYQVMFTQISGTAYSDKATEEEKQEAVQKYLFFFPVCSISSAFFTMVCGFYLVTKGIKASKQLHGRIIQNLLNASVQYFYNQISGSFIKNRLTNDIYQFDMNTQQQINNVISSLFNLLANLIACVVTASSISFPVIAIYVVLQVYYTVKYLRVFVELARLQALTRSPILKFQSETAEGVVFIKNCGSPTKNIQQFNQLVNEYQKTNITLASINTWYQQVITSMMVVMYIFVLSANYWDFDINRAQATISTYLATMVGELFLTFTTNVQTFYSDQIYLQRCLYLTRQIQQEFEQSMSASQTQYQDSVDNASSQKPQESGRVALQIENLHLKYRDDFDFAIKQFSLSLTKRQKVAIIGRTGSGKTSLIQSITALITPFSGSISINGVNYKDLTYQQIRSHYAVISQDPFTFEGTIKENIDPQGRYSDQQIADCLSSYGLGQVEFLKNLYQNVEPHGANLSQGQKQLLALCRLLMQKSSILILDECTGNLDSEYGHLILQSLKKASENSAVIGVTHKLDQLEMFEEVVLLNRGKIVATGKRNYVLQKYLQQSIN